MSYLLCGDIGGTNIRLQLFKYNNNSSSNNDNNYDNDKLILIYTNKYLSKSSNLIDIIKLFISSATQETLKLNIKAAVLAIAGPIINNTCYVTNLGWNINGNELSRIFNIMEFKLINDFIAQGYGLLGLNNDEKVLISNILPKCDKLITYDPIACLGAGTGLGEVYLTCNTLINNNHMGHLPYIAWPSEGGHADFAPRNLLEFELLMFIKEKERVDRVSVERVCSGSALPMLYSFLASKKPNLISGDVTKEMAADDASAVISKYGLGHENGTAEDILCRNVLELFCSIYGSEAGNLALKTLCNGGLYIAGGVSPRILIYPYFSNIFYSNYLEKGRMRSVLSNIPVYLVKHFDVGLLGAQILGLRLVEELALPISNQIMSFDDEPKKVYHGVDSESSTLSPTSLGAPATLAVKKESKIFGVNSGIFILIAFLCGVSAALLYIAEINSHMEYSVACGIVFWTSFYWLLCLYYDNLPNGLDIVDGYTRGSYHVAVFHQTGVIVIMTLYLLVMRYYDSEWLEAGWGSHYWMERAVHLSIVGYEAKDFAIMELSVGFIFHHTLACLGCIFCLIVPGGAGYLTAVALIAELGSSLANLNSLFNKVLTIPYLIAMTTSNILAIYLTYHFCFVDIHEVYHIVFIVLAIGLISFRTLGTYSTFIEFMNSSKIKTI